MSNVPATLRYTEEHEWAQAEGDVVVIGITDHAQSALGDVVFLELPAAGKEIRHGKSFGTVESVKAVSELYAPLDAVVVEVNQALIDSPEQVNKDPYGAAWMLKVKPKDPAAFAGLLDAAAYTALLATLAK
jgi:glycine cleavage system H protein